MRSKLIKEQEDSWLPSSLGIRTPLSQISLAAFFVWRAFNKLIQGIKWMKWLTGFY